MHTALRMLYTPSVRSDGFHQKKGQLARQYAGSALLLHGVSSLHEEERRKADVLAIRGPIVLKEK